MIQGRVLIISDNGSVNQTISDILRLRDYEVAIAADGISALNYVRSGFDLAILQYGLRDYDIKDLVKQLLLIDPCLVISLVVESRDINTAAEFPRNGIFEVVVLPINIEKFTFLVKVAIRIHLSATTHKKVVLSLEERNASLQKQNILLAKRIEESTKNLSHLYDDLRSTYMRTVRSLIEAIDARDHYTRSHSQKVSYYALKIAERLGLSMKEVENLRQACELHDVGKIGIDDRILTKPGPLNDEEWEQIRLHAVKGAQILEPLTFLEDVVMIVRQHHERYDGKGYPDGLKGEEIVLGARIVNLADAYDVMTSARTYRKEILSKQEAIEEIKRSSGKQFDPKIVDVFLKIADEL